MSTYTPSVSFISSITRGPLTVVQFTQNCDFTVGEIVSFRVSKASGTFELNNQQALVLAVSGNQITVDLPSQNYTPFINLGENGTQYPAMVIPSSSGIVPNSFPIQTSLEDAFDNVPNN